MLARRPGRSARRAHRRRPRNPGAHRLRCRGRGASSGGSWSRSAPTRVGRHDVTGRACVPVAVAHRRRDGAAPPARPAPGDRRGEPAHPRGARGRLRRGVRGRGDADRTRRRRAARVRGQRVAGGRQRGRRLRQHRRRGRQRRRGDRHQHPRCARQRHGRPHIRPRARRHPQGGRRRPLPAHSPAVDLGSAHVHRSGRERGCHAGHPRLRPDRQGGGATGPRLRHDGAGHLAAPHLRRRRRRPVRRHRHAAGRQRRRVC